MCPEGSNHLAYRVLVVQADMIEPKCTRRHGTSVELFIPSVLPVLHARHNCVSVFINGVLMCIGGYGYILVSDGCVLVRNGCVLVWYWFVLVGYGCVFVKYLHVLVIKGCVMVR